MAQVAALMCAMVDVPLRTRAVLPHTRAPRTPSPIAFDDAPIVLAAAGLAAAAGVLQYSVSAGDKGLNAFLTKEKMNNPFYSADFKQDRPKAPRWLSGLRLPELPFVEVYGQPSASRGVPMPRAADPAQEGDTAALYRELNAAVEREDYAMAADIKKQIDAILCADYDSTMDST